MAITFLRIDDRVIHGQITTRWIRECPCDGIVAVNDSIAEDPILKKIYINACDKKVFIWTIAEWLEKRERVIESKKNYFLITKTAMDMKRILVDESFDPKRGKFVLVHLRCGRIQSLWPERNFGCPRKKLTAWKSCTKRGTVFCLPWCGKVQ